jgi:hypothetical protein
LHHTTIATTIRRGMIALARQSAVADVLVLGSRYNHGDRRPATRSLTWQVEKQVRLTFLIVIESQVEFLRHGLELSDTGECYV